MNDTTMIIKLYDDDKGEYPLIRIHQNKLIEFKAMLELYKKSDDYNIEEFIALLENCFWYVGTIYIDEEVYF